MIPLTSFRYNDCDPSKITNIYFYIEHGMGANSGSISVSEPWLNYGADNILVDNMEVDESPYDLSALMFDIYKSSGNSGGSAYSFATNVMTNTGLSNTHAYCLKHVTRVTNTQWAYAQSVRISECDPSTGCNGLRSS
jgi:hypothetical protein